MGTCNLNESISSRRGRDGDGDFEERVYNVRGEATKSAAMTAVQNFSPTTAAGLPRQAIDIDPVGFKLWRGTVRYAKTPRTGAQVPELAAESLIEIDTSGGTQTVFTSVNTSAYGTGAASNDNGGLVNVSADSVEGAEIVVPVFNFTARIARTTTEVTSTYIATLYNLTGKVNDASFSVGGLNFLAGELLFLGATTSIRTDDTVELTYRFSANKNLTNETIGGITYSKKGWEFIWIRSVVTKAGSLNVPTRKPVAVYVEQVYQDAAFTGLII